MTRTFGRTTLDDRGVRKVPLLWLFGSPFNVAWGDITGWATSEVVLTGGGPNTVISGSLELHTAETIHFVRASGADLDAMAKEVERHLPGKRVESILVTMQQLRGRGR